MKAERKLISSGSSFEEQIGYSLAAVDGDWIFMSGTTGFNYMDMTISDDKATRIGGAGYLTQLIKFYTDKPNNLLIS
jgi:hypothetical protein